MKLLLIRHLWGIDEPWEIAFPKIRECGYGGIESSVPKKEDQERFRKLLDQFRFEYIAQIHTSGANYKDHIESFAQQVEAAKELQPMFINSHSGRDYFNESEQIEFFNAAIDIEHKQGIMVAHETHRGRVLYNPWTTSRILSKYKHLKLTADLSHWVCVCERLITDQIDIIKQCARQTLHIHARVGHEQGPQVSDPRAPEFQKHLETHEEWWRLIWESQKERNLTVSTLVPEFGPHYMPTLPYTNVPLANLWDICNWQAKRQQDNFSRLFSE